MNIKKIDKLLKKQNIKDYNNIDSSSEFIEMLKEIANDAPDMTLEDIRKRNKLEYIKIFSKIPMSDSLLNLYKILESLDVLVDEVNHIVISPISNAEKKNLLSHTEEKLSVLLTYLCDVILEYVNGPQEETEEENPLFIEKADVYINSLFSQREESFDIVQYYSNVIEFYRFFSSYTKELVAKHNKVQLYYITLWAGSVLVMRCDILRAHYLK